MSARSVALLVALGGCNRLWGATTVTAIADAADDSPDALVHDAATPISDRCVPTFPSDTFDDQPACIGVGVPLGGADSLDLDAGNLMVSLSGATGQLGGCLSHAVVAFGEGGIFADVPQIAAGPNTYNFLALHWADGMTTTSLFASSSGLALQHVTTSTTGPVLGTTPVLAPWWRIRPSEDRTAIVGEWSQDGTHWTTFAIDPVPAPDRAYLELAFGDFADGPASFAVVASINVCP